jgi:hypothetical protein
VAAIVPTNLKRRNRHFFSNLQLNKNIKKSLVAIEIIFLFYCFSSNAITKLLINLKQQLRTIRRLPKACRHLAADKLSSIINNCLSTKSISSFEDLLLFSYRAFNVAEKSDKSLNKPRPAV